MIHAFFFYLVNLNHSPTPFITGCISQAVKLGTQIQPLYRIFSLEELKEATKSFERSAFLGEGTIGKVCRCIFTSVQSIESKWLFQWLDRPI
jgi:hypothetical protein